MDNKNTDNIQVDNDTDSVEDTIKRFNDNAKKTGALGLKHWQVIMLGMMFYDYVTAVGSYGFALLLRFDLKFLSIPEKYLVMYYKIIFIYAAVCIVVFFIFKLYQSVWRFASYHELKLTTYAAGVALILHIIIAFAIVGRMPISYFVFGIAFQYMFMMALRFSYRLLLIFKSKNEETTKADRIMLIGAGNAGQMLLRDIRLSREGKGKVYCIIDDNPNKWNRYIDGVPVVGGRDSIMANAEKYAIDKIYLAIPKASPENKRDILNICKETGCELKNLPAMYQIVNGEINVEAMKDVAVEELLGREPIEVNLDEICSYIEGKTVLVTGGGGSIGSELCRQVAGHKVGKLIIFDVYENSAYDIEQELRHDYPKLDLEVLIGSVRDSRRINEVFEQYKPDICYHAAAHKHVPLMEDSPCEAIKNNAVGTYKTAYAAMIHGCKRFVLISTDKAVNPTNIMGASKRLCEMVIQTFDYYIKAGKPEALTAMISHDNEEYEELNIPDNFVAKTEFMAVRFGNVLGSNGSVIPLFKKQIAAGGPVTVTDPRITRFFMTISEAVSLVLQAGVYAKGGEIFVLDMGEQVLIDDLARNLIKLSGFKPDVDIKIEYTGLRPGEKLYEEKLMAEEGLTKTSNKTILIGKPLDFKHELFLEELRGLTELAYKNIDNDEIRSAVAKVVKTYNPSI